MHVVYVITPDSSHLQACMAFYLHITSVHFQLREVHTGLTPQFIILIYVTVYDTCMYCFFSLWFWMQEAPAQTEHPQVEQITVYGSTVLLGAGGSTVLVTSLSMVADLIGPTVVCMLSLCTIKVLARSLSERANSGNEQLFTLTGF